MSQYGARGRAIAGQTSTQILAHYYHGATLGTVSKALPSASCSSRNSERPRRTPSSSTAGSRRGPSTGSTRRSRPTPSWSSSRPRRPRQRARTTWRLRITNASGTTLFSGAEARDLGHPRPPPARAVSSSGRNRPPTIGIRGALRVIAGSRRRPRRSSTNCRSSGTCAVWWRPRCHRSGRRRRSIPRRSRRGRTPPVAFNRVSRSTTSPTVGLAGLSRRPSVSRASTNLVVGATAGKVLRSGTAIANTLFSIRPEGGATRTTRTSTSRPTGPRSPAQVSYLRGSSDRCDPTGPLLRCGRSRTPPGRPRTYTRHLLSA